MLTDEVYDPFLFIPVYMSMYYHTDLYLRGKVSKQLYRNIIDYVQPLLCDFSPDLVKTNIIVDGFQEIESEHSVIGTGISCGVDCLATIKKYYVEEDDSDYKLTHLFMLNVGWHGNYYNENTIPLFRSRCKANMKAANEMGLKFVAVDSNIDAFYDFLNDKASFFALYTAAFCFQKALCKYYISSSFSYGEVLKYGNRAMNKDFSEYGEAIALPLMQNDSLRLISDGLQMTRVQKTDYISDWEIARKYLNVCCRHSNDIGVDESNCSECVKCKRTLIALDGLGKLDCFSSVFDLKKYRKHRKDIVKWVVSDHLRNAFASEIWELYKGELE